jgi:hypothetical protein
MRASRVAERARWSWLTTRSFGEAIGTEEAHVRSMIAEGWFKRDGDVPECLNVAKPGAKKPEYRIHPNAVRRFYRERAA